VSLAVRLFRRQAVHASASTCRYAFLYRHVADLANDTILLSTIELVCAHGRVENMVTERLLTLTMEARAQRPSARSPFGFLRKWLSSRTAAGGEDAHVATQAQLSGMCVPLRCLGSKC